MARNCSLVTPVTTASPCARQRGIRGVTSGRTHFDERDGVGVLGVELAEQLHALALSHILPALVRRELRLEERLRRAHLVGVPFRRVRRDSGEFGSLHGGG